MTNGEIGMITTPNERRNPGRLHVEPACPVFKKRCPHEHHHAVAAVWAADNGCFSTNYLGDERWLAWLRRHAVHATRCAFATAPDVVGDAWATLIRSLPFLPVIRELGYPAALVAQDGLEDLPGIPWDAFDVLFVGGTDAWKLGEAAAAIVGEAKARGKPVHMGRVNSGKRITYATAIGCDTADGTFLVKDPDGNLERLRAWPTARPAA